MKEKLEAEKQVALLNWLAADSENKYFLGLLAGAGTSVLSQAIGIAVSESGEVSDTDSNELIISISKWDLLGGPLGLAGSVGADIGSWLADQIGDDNATTDRDSILRHITESVALSGATISGLCYTMLILKNIGPTLNGIGEMIPL